MIFPTHKIYDSLIAGAWNLYKIKHDVTLLSIFIRFMSDPDYRLREKAAYYVPALLTPELTTCLEGMIRTETEQLARIHAVDKLLECYGVTEESIGKDKFLSLYRGLHSEDLKMKELKFKYLHSL